MIFFWNRKANGFSKNYPEIISILETGEPKAIDYLLWQPVNAKIKYLPISYDMIMKFKKPNTSTQSLEIHKTFDKGKYQLIVFKVPWIDKDVKYSPIIFDKLSLKIVGIMLPFNELHGYLSIRDNSDIGKLGIEWTGFILSVQFGI